MQLALSDTYWKFIQTLNRAKKWFNSIFIQNLNLKYSFKQKTWLFIQQNIHKKIHDYSFNKIFIQQKNSVSHRASCVAIYAVLLQNLFCRDLRAFVWRKIEPKNVEKKRQISGMVKSWRTPKFEKLRNHWVYSFLLGQKLSIWLGQSFCWEC